MLLYSNRLQANYSEQSLTNDIKKNINILLPVGKMTADIMDSTKTNKRQEDLTKKFQEKVRKNHQ